MKWFQHPSTSADNELIKKLVKKYGAKGYGVYWHLLELIVADIDYDESFDFNVYAQKISKDLQEPSVKEIMNYMVSLGLFDLYDNQITWMKIANGIGYELV